MIKSIYLIESRAVKATLLGLAGLGAGAYGLHHGGEALNTYNKYKEAAPEAQLKYQLDRHFGTDFIGKDAEKTVKHGSKAILGTVGGAAGLAGAAHIATTKDKKNDNR